MKRVMRVGGAVTVGLLLAANAWAITPGDKCEAAKLKTAGKYSFCRLKAEAKAVKTGDAPDYSKCDEKLTSKWGPLETAAGGMCPSNGDESAMQAFISQHADDVAAALDGGPLPDCPAALACGNGSIDVGEDCDLGTLNGATCITEGFAGGVLSCADGCAFDTGGCFAVRFVDNADGTITDNATSLMWEKKTELGGGPNFANPHDADNGYRWSGACTVLASKRCQPTADAAALCVAHVQGDPDGCSECTGGEGTCNSATTMWTTIAALNTANFAGYTDWRAPTRQELQAIVDDAAVTPPAVNVAFHGASCGVACTDITNPVCSCTGFNVESWSATSYQLSSQFAWVIFFGDGGVYPTSKPNFHYVRAVRGGS